jgi:hypothetical protein
VKRKRGLRQKSFPIPRTCAEGIAIAVLGKVGGSEATQLLLRESESRLAAFIKEKTDAGGKPFEELALAEKALSTPGTIADKRRLVAMHLRLGCYHLGIPFTRRLLGEWYRRRMPRNEISSSTLSRLFRWANAVRSVM